MKADDDGRCAFCGGYRAACSPYGRLCCFFDEHLSSRPARATDVAWPDGDTRFPGYGDVTGADELS